MQTYGQQGAVHRSQIKRSEPMTLSTHTYGKKTIGGSVPHYVTNEAGDKIGWIDEVFGDVFYVMPAGRLYADNRRYRSIADALTSPEWANASVMWKAA
jgi:hypothetical protein